MALPQPKSGPLEGCMEIVMYLKRTRNYENACWKEVGLELTFLADSNHVSNSMDRRSVSGGAAKCAGTAVTWLSRTQCCVTDSSSKARYVSMKILRTGSPFLYKGFFRGFYSLNVVFCVVYLILTTKGPSSSRQPSEFNGLADIKIFGIVLAGEGSQWCNSCIVRANDTTTC